MKDINLYGLVLLCTLFLWASLTTPPAVVTTASLPAPAAHYPIIDDAGQEDAALRNIRKYWWRAGVTARDPVKVLIDLTQQQAAVYAGTVLVGRSVISSGHFGYISPTGDFSILEKNEYYASKRYGDSPMPYMQRITTDGIALHGGHVPNRPASRGCIRFPVEFAKLLFEYTDHRTRVVIY